MPWYPGPVGPNFWDGQRWLVWQSAEYLEIQGTKMAFDAIAEISYWDKHIVSIRNVHGSGPSRIVRGFTITDHSGQSNTLTLDLLGLQDNPEYQSVFAGLVDISRRFIEPRIAHRLFALLQAGGQYTIGGGLGVIELSNRGFVGRFLRKQTYSWSEFYTVNVNVYHHNMTPSANGQVGVWAKRAHKAKPQIATGLWTDVPNAVVLTTLLPRCAAAFAPDRPLIGS